MMCDTTAVRNWLTAALVAVLLAVAMIAAAIIANGSFWGAWMSPVWMGAAAIATAAALGALAMAIGALDALCACLAGACAGPCANLRTNIRAIQLVLGIQLTATISAAFAAWIPFAPIPVMSAILGALVVQAVLLISAIAFLASLLNCAGSNSPTGRVTSRSDWTRGGP